MPHAVRHAALCTAPHTIPLLMHSHILLFCLPPAASFFMIAQLTTAVQAPSLSCISTTTTLLAWLLCCCRCSSTGTSLWSSLCTYIRPRACPCSCLRPPFRPPCPGRGCCTLSGCPHREKASQPGLCCPCDWGGAESALETASGAAH